VDAVRKTPPLWKRSSMNFTSKWLPSRGCGGRLCRGSSLLAAPARDLAPLAVPQYAPISESFTLYSWDWYSQVVQYRSPQLSKTRPLSKLEKVSLGMVALYDTPERPVSLKAFPEASTTSMPSAVKDTARRSSGCWGIDILDER